MINDPDTILLNHQREVLTKQRNDKRKGKLRAASKFVKEHTDDRK